MLRIGRTVAYELAREAIATDGASGMPTVVIGRQFRVPRVQLEELLGGPITWPIPTAPRTSSPVAEPPRPTARPRHGRRTLSATRSCSLRRPACRTTDTKQRNVNDINMTDENCHPGRDEQDHWLLDFFSGTLTVTAMDDHLTLSNESNSITFEYVMEPEGAADSPPPVSAPPQVTLPNARFVSATIEGDHPLADTPVQLRFEEFSLDVTAVCNNITIVYRIDDTILKADDSSITAADCGSPRNEQDRWIEAFMSSWPMIAVGDDELTLSNATNSIMFVKPT